MPRVAVFPSPIGPPAARVYIALQEWTGSGWRCYQTEICDTYWWDPYQLDSYDGRQRHKQLFTVLAAPYLLSTFWYLAEDGRWYLHRRWTNRTDHTSDRGWGGEPLYS